MSNPQEQKRPLPRRNCDRCGRGYQPSLAEHHWCEPCYSSVRFIDPDTTDDIGLLREKLRLVERAYGLHVVNTSGAQLLEEEFRQWLPALIQLTRQERHNNSDLAIRVCAWLLDQREWAETKRQ